MPLNQAFTLELLGDDNDPKMALGAVRHIVLTTFIVHLQEFGVEPSHRNIPIEVDADFEIVRSTILKALERNDSQELVH